MDFLTAIPAWLPPAIIAGGCGLAALVIYILGAAQGYTHEDYRNARRRARRGRRNQQSRRR